MVSEPYSYRGDPGVPAFADDRPIIVFDGHCALCSGWARLVLRNDRKGRYRLLPAQTALGRAVYVHYGLDPVDYETNLLIQDGRLYVKSEGTTRMFEGLGLPWSLLAVMRVLPLSWRDGLYGVMARNRLKWFGRREVCFLGEAGWQDRFLA
jgi:predicted DCC family thiol-disulfide oxidoreductase YuxK